MSSYTTCSSFWLKGSLRLMSYISKPERLGSACSKGIVWDGHFWILRGLFSMTCMMRYLSNWGSCRDSMIVQVGWSACYPSKV